MSPSAARLLAHLEQQADEHRTVRDVTNRDLYTAVMGHEPHRRPAEVTRWLAELVQENAIETTFGPLRNARTIKLL